VEFLSHPSPLAAGRSGRLAAGHRLALRAYPDARTASRAFIPVAGLALVFTLADLVVLSLPMGMRHGT